MIKRVLFVILLLLVLGQDSQKITRATETYLESITVENVRWLIPLLRTQLGEVDKIAWMPGEEQLAVEMSTGVWIYSINDFDDVTVDLETGVFYPGISQITLNVNRTHIVGLEVIEDVRPDQPPYANVWDLASGEMIVSLSGVTGITALSPDGRTLAVQDDETNPARIGFYSLETGRRTDVFVAPQHITGIAYSYSGQYLAVTGHYADIDSYRDGYFLVYDLVGRRIITMQEQGEDNRVDTYFVPQFSPDDNLIVLTNGWNVIQYWLFEEDPASLTDITANYIELGYNDDDDGLVSLPDGTTFSLNPMTSTYGIRAYQWRRLDETTVQTPLGNQLNFMNPSSIRYDPERQYLYHLGENNPNGEIQTINGLTLVPRPYALNFFTQTIDPKGLNIVAYVEANHTLDLVNIRNLNGYTFSSNRDGVQGNIYGVTISQDFQYVMYGDREVANTIVREINTGNLIARLSSLTDFVFSPDSTLAIGKIGGTTGVSAELWDLTTNIRLHTLQLPPSEHTYTSTHFAFSPDGQMVMAMHDNRLRVWNVESGEIVHDVAVDLWFNAVPLFSYTQDGEWLGLVSNQTSSHMVIYLWDQDSIRSGILPDEQYSQRIEINIISNDEYQIEAINAQTGEAIPLTTDYTENILTFEYAETSETFVSFFVSPWEYTIYPSYIQSNRYIRNQARTLYARGNSNIIYDASTGEALTLLGGQTQPYHQIEFAPDGMTIATTNGLQATVWGVPISPEDPSEVVCEGAPPTQLQTGIEAVVTGTNGPRDLRVRSYPNGVIVDSVPSYTSVQVVRGPVCERGVLWWGVETLDGSTYGWSAEAISSDDYLLIAP